MSVQAPPGTAGRSGGGTVPLAPMAGAGRRRQVAMAGLAASLLVAVAFVAYAVAISRQVPTSKYANLILYKTPAKAPSFDLARLGNGARVTSSVIGEGPAVVNWFQSDCVACQAELGTFASVAGVPRWKIH